MIELTLPIPQETKYETVKIYTDLPMYRKSEYIDDAGVTTNKYYKIYRDHYYYIERNEYAESADLGRTNINDKRLYELYNKRDWSDWHIYDSSEEEFNEIFMENFSDLIVNIKTN